MFLEKYSSLQQKGSNPYQPATSCVRDQHATTAPATSLRERNFKLIPIDDSMIMSFPEFAEFSKIYAPFRKNPITGLQKETY